MDCLVGCDSDLPALPDSNGNIRDVLVLAEVVVTEFDVAVVVPVEDVEF